jgi:hypothetical protein
MPHCEICTTQTTVVCGYCKKIYYCSAKCQKENWNHHKHFCSIYVWEKVISELNNHPQFSNKGCQSTFAAVLGVLNQNPMKFEMSICEKEMVIEPESTRKAENTMILRTLEQENDSNASIYALVITHPSNPNTTFEHRWFLINYKEYFVRIQSFRMDDLFLPFSYTEMNKDEYLLNMRSFLDETIWEDAREHYINMFGICPSLPHNLPMKPRLLCTKYDCLPPKIVLENMQNFKNKFN